MLVPLPPSRGSAKLQKIVRSDSNDGLSATSSSPPCPRASTGSRPAIGSPMVPVADTMRRRPAFSVTSTSPPGSGSTDHGFSSPRATTTTSCATFELMAQARVWPGNDGR